MGALDRFDPRKQFQQAEDAIRNNDPGRAARAIMPIGGAIVGWKGDDATLPGIEISPEQQAAADYGNKKANLVQDMQGQAKQFRQNLPGYERDLYSQIEGQAKTAIADKQSDIKRQANRRGLLYSGLRKGDQARAASKIGSEAAGQKAKVAPQLDAQAEAMDQMAAKVAQANYQDDLALAGQAWDRALTDAKNRTAQLGQLGEAAGNFAGQYFGSKNAESDTYERQKREYSMSLNPDGTLNRSNY